MLQRNPVLQKELLTWLVSRKSFLIQLAFMAVLALSVIYFWPTDDQPGSQHQIGRTLFNNFFTTQMILAVALVPAVAASSISVERERGSLDLLLTTPISRWQLVLGKFVSTVTFMVLVFLCTAPIMVVCFLLGGFSLSELMANYLHLTVTVGVMAASGIVISAHRDRTLAALGVSYPVCIVICAMMVGLRGTLIGNYAMDVALFVGTGALAFCGIALLVAAVRLNHLPDVAPRSLDREKPKMRSMTLVLDRTKWPDRLFMPPRKQGLLPDGSNPILDKEFRSEIYGRGTQAIRSIIMLGVLGIPVVTLTCFSYEGGYLYFVFYFMGLMGLLAPAFSAPSLTQEWERDSMELLLTTLLTPLEIILGKLWIACRMILVIAVFNVVPLTWFAVTTVSVNRVTRLSLASAAYLWPAMFSVPLVAVLIGLFFSSLCRRTVTAVVSSYTSLFMLCVAPLIIPDIFELQGDPSKWVRMVSPFGAALEATLCRGGAWISSTSPLLYFVFISALCAFLLATATWRFSLSMKAD